METINKWGFNWRIGQPWGKAHPDHKCYTGEGTVEDTAKGIRLGIDYNPAMVDVEGCTKLRLWDVGMITSVEPVKYGTLYVKFVLPQGRELWPAIWLADNETWPPEIDIVEGWTNHILKGEKCYRRVCGRIPIPFTNDIFPSLHYGDTAENHKTKSYRNLLKGTASSLLHTDGKDNDCSLQWHPDKIVIYWNGEKVMEETDPTILKWYNSSNGMRIILNNYVTNDFEWDYYIKLLKETSGMIIKDLRYIP